MTNPPDIGRAVKEALANDGQGQVIAVFSRACYVNIDGHVFALLSTSDVSGPLHARMEVLPVFQIGDMASVESGSLYIKNEKVPLSEDCWNPGPLPKGEGIDSMLGSALKHEPVLDMGSGESGSLADSLEAAWSRGGIGMACHQLFGRGSGLTPSGDDVAAGMMIAHFMLGLSDDAFRLSIVADAPTHAISRAFLSSAARGQSIEPIHRLLEACAVGDFRSVRAWRDRLAEIGYTSGLDLAYGVFIGLRCASVTTSDSRPSRRIATTALAQTTA